MESSDWDIVINYFHIFFCSFNNFIQLFDKIPIIWIVRTEFPFKICVEALQVIGRAFVILEYRKSRRAYLF